MITYGNYLGNNYNRYPLDPIDDLDYCCFLHDIDHRLSGGNNRFADRELNHRLKKISFKKLSITGKLFYIFARYLYSGFYAHIVRDIPFLKDKISNSEYTEERKWRHSNYHRVSMYNHDSEVFKKTFPKLY